MMFYLSIYQDFSSSNTKFFKKKVKEGGGILLGKHAVQVSEPCHMFSEQSLPISPLLRSKRVECE